jgi:hypothetical protein
MQIDNDVEQQHIGLTSLQDLPGPLICYRGMLQNLCVRICFIKISKAPSAGVDAN